MPNSGIRAINGKGGEIRNKWPVDADYPKESIKKYKCAVSVARTWIWAKNLLFNSLWYYESNSSIGPHPCKEKDKRCITDHDKGKLHRRTLLSLGRVNCYDIIHAFPASFLDSPLGPNSVTARS